MIKKEFEYIIREKPKYYFFNQNNSGGFWKGTKYVIIKAESLEQANNVATSLINVDIYFGGYGDCSCCGHRWSKAQRWDEYNQPEIWDNTVIKKQYGELNSFIGIVIPGKFKLLDYSETTIDLVEEFRLLEESKCY